MSRLVGVGRGRRAHRGGSFLRRIRGTRGELGRSLVGILHCAKGSELSTTSRWQWEEVVTLVQN